MRSGKAKMRCVWVVLLALLLACSTAMASAQEAEAQAVPTPGSILIDGTAYKDDASGAGWSLSLEEDGFALALEGYAGGAIQSGESLRVELSGDNGITGDVDYALGANGDLQIAGGGRLAISATAPQADSWVQGLWAAGNISVDSTVDITVTGGAYAAGIVLDDRVEDQATAGSLLFLQNAAVTVEARPQGASSYGTLMAAGIVFHEDGNHLLTVEKGAVLRMTADALEEAEGETLAVGLDARNTEILFAGDVEITALAGSQAYGVSAFKGGILTATGSRLQVRAEADHAVGMRVMDDMHFYGETHVQGSTEAFLEGSTIFYGEDALRLPESDQDIHEGAQEVSIMGSIGGPGTSGGDTSGSTGGRLAVGFAVLLAAILLMAAYLSRPRWRASGMRVVSCALAAVLLLGSIQIPVMGLAQEDGAAASQAGLTEADVLAPMNEELIAFLASYENEGVLAEKSPQFIQGIVLAVGGKIIDYATDRAIDWALGDLFDNIFPKDDPKHKEIMDTLKSLESKLDKIDMELQAINAKLDEIIKKLREIQKEQEAQKVRGVLQNHRQRMVPLSTAVSRARGNINGTKDPKKRQYYIEDFYVNAPVGKRPTVEYIMNTLKLMQDDGSGMDIFTSYDKYTEFSGWWESPGYAFRESRRVTDTLTLLEALSLCSVYQRGKLYGKKVGKCPVSEFDVKFLKDTVTAVMDYYNDHAVERLLPDSDRCRPYQQKDIVLYGCKPMSQVDFTEFGLEDKTWRGVLHSYETGGRALTRDEFKAMMASAGVPFVFLGKGRLEKFFNGSALEKILPKTFDIITSEPLYYFWVSQENRYIVKVATFSVNDATGEESDGSVIAIALRKSKDRDDPPFEKPVLLKDNYVLLGIGLPWLGYGEEHDLLTAEGEITRLPSGYLALNPYDGGGEMTFILSDASTQVEGELKIGSHAEVSYFPLLGGDPDLPGGEVTRYAEQVVCHPYAPVPFEVSGLVTQVAGNALTLMDAGGQEHGFLLTDTEIEGELREGVHAVASCYRQDDDTVVVTRLVCSGFVDKPVMLTGTVSELSPWQMTLALDAGEQDIELLEDTVIRGEVDVGSLVKVTAHKQGKDLLADSVEAVEDPVPTPAPKPETFQGTVTERNDDLDALMPGEPRSIALDDGHTILLPDDMELDNEVMAGAVVEVTAHQTEAGWMADGIEVITPAPAPGPVPVPEPDPDPAPGPVPVPEPDPDPVPEPDPVDDPIPGPLPDDEMPA